MHAPDRTTRLAPLEAYIAQLDTMLAGIPLNERREIILETRSHVVERTQRDPSMPIEDVLAELGDPPSYALGFLPKRQRETDCTTLTNIASIATSGWQQLPILLLVAAGYGIAALLALVAIAKVLEPNATGWYVSNSGGRRFVGLVLSEPNHVGRDILGYWLVPITLAASGAIHWLLSRLLRRVARKSSPLL